MKKILALLLVTALAVGAFAGCKKEPEAPAAPEPIRILAIGNRQALDGMQLLFEVFQAEQPERQVVLGVLDGEDYRLDQHKAAAEEAGIDYSYYKNVSGHWEVSIECSMDDALKDDAWDVVVLQELNTVAGKANTFNDDDLSYLSSYIKSRTGDSVRLYWQFVWSNPEIPADTATEDMWMFRDTRQQTAQMWCEFYEKTYQNDSGVMFDAMAANVQTYVLDGGLGFEGVIPTATVIQHLKNVSKVEDSYLYRDYACLSDAGRLAAAYVWYARLCGLEEIGAVSVAEIPAALRHYSFAEEGDLLLEERYREQVKAAVNYALQNPLTRP